MPTKKHLSILIAIFSISVFCQAQNAEQVYAHAVQLYAEQDYEEAIYELRRLIFFEDTAYTPAYIMLGDCYRQSDNTDKAIYFYNLAAELEQCDSTLMEIQFRKIGTYLQHLQPQYALMKLLSLPDTPDTYFTAERSFYMFACYYQLSDYQVSKEYLYSSLSWPTDTLTPADSVFILAMENFEASAYLPMFLSIIPGMGQLYLGEYGAALNSFLLNGAFIGLYFVALQYLPVFDAVIMVLPWLHRYYQGGMLDAKRLAEIKKKRLDDEYFNALLDIYSDQKK